MTLDPSKWMTAAFVAALLAVMPGCHTCGSCNNCDSCNTGGCRTGCGLNGKLAGCLQTRSNAIPDQYPIGSVMREHFEKMETNAEASDFVFHHHEFVGETSELTSDGKDHLMEVAARMRSAPFPVLVERSENNANPELDAERRHIVASALNTLGNADADQRVIVSQAYTQGLRGVEGEYDYGRFLFSRGTNGFNNGFNNGTNGGNFGGAGGFGFGR